MLDDEPHQLVWRSRRQTGLHHPAHVPRAESVQRDDVGLACQGKLEQPLRRIRLVSGGPDEHQR